MILFLLPRTYRCGLVQQQRRVISVLLSTKRMNTLLPIYNQVHSKSNSNVDLKYIRNLGIVAHIDAGKTTTTENMLYVAGETKSVGRVDTGDTVTDFLPQERERGITINSAIIEFSWRDHLISLIDTPGHVDFTIEVERSCRVLDGVVLVVDAVAGVQAQTKTVWRQAKKQSIPAVAFVNKMDRDGASFERCIKSIRSKLNVNAVPLQLPVFEDSRFCGAIDLISMERLIWEPTGLNGKPAIYPSNEKLSPTDPMYKATSQARRAMLEAIAELDEAFMEVFFKFEDNPLEIPQNDIVNALKRQCILNTIVPAICGASLKGIGIQPLLNSVIAFLPSPADRPAVTARDTKSSALKQIQPEQHDLCALAFKVTHDEARGLLVYVRVYSGVLIAKQVLHNSTRGEKERVSQILKISADDLEHISEIGPGQVGCLVGLRKTSTGDTLVVEGGPLQNYVLTGLTLPKAVFALAVEPEKSSQQDALEKALAILCSEDPSLHVDVDKESGQTLIRGIGELHLEIVVDKLRRQFKIDVSTGRAYVAFRETLVLESDEETSSFDYDRVIGNKRLSVSLTFTLRANHDKSPPRLFIDDIIPQLSHDERYSLEESFQGCISRGPRGFPVVGFDVKIVQIQRTPHTDAGAIRACLSMFLNSVLKGPHRCLLEPIMNVEICLPSAHLGEVLSDLSMKRRGFVRDVTTEEFTSVIHGHVPLATMLGYATAIRSMTQGDGSFSLEYKDHEAVEESIIEYLHI